MISIVEDSKGVIVYARTEKIVSFESMVNALEFIKNNPDLPRELRIIEDAQGVEANFSIEELRALVDNMSSAGKNYVSIKHAVVHDNPKNTAYAFIVQNQTQDSNYSLKTFITLSGAIKWIEFDGTIPNQ